jgi:hypothetical protein
VQETEKSRDRSGSTRTCKLGLIFLGSPSDCDTQMAASTLVASMAAPRSLTLVKRNTTRRRAPFGIQQAQAVFAVPPMTLYELEVHDASWEVRSAIPMSAPVGVV